MGMGSMETGKRIQQSRRERGLSQEQLAERVGISVTHMSNIENGKTGFSLPVLVRLRDELGVTADFLLFGPPKGESEAYRMVARELEALLEGCTGAQAEAVLGVIRSMGVLLRQCGTEPDGKV